MLLNKFSEKVNEQIIPNATIITPEMASKIKQAKYRENDKKEKEKRAEKERKMVGKLYKQTIKVIEKWIYDENDCRLDIRYYPYLRWYFLYIYCDKNEKKYLEKVVILIQQKIGNAYEVSVDSYCPYDIYFIRVTIV